MTFKLGDIWLAKCHPAVGREFKKFRPVLIIQSEETLTASDYVTVIPLSSQIENFDDPSIFVIKDFKNRLQSDSLLIVNHIVSYDHSRFIKKIGSASSPVLRQVRGYLRRHFRL